MTLVPLRCFYKKHYILYNRQNIIQKKKQVIFIFFYFFFLTFDWTGYILKQIINKNEV